MTNCFTDFFKNINKISTEKPSKEENMIIKKIKAFKKNFPSRIKKNSTILDIINKISAEFNRELFDLIEPYESNPNLIQFYHGFVILEGFTLCKEDAEIILDNLPFLLGKFEFEIISENENDVEIEIFNYLCNLIKISKSVPKPECWSSIFKFIEKRKNDSRLFKTFEDMLKKLFIEKEDNDDTVKTVLRILSRNNTLISSVDKEIIINNTDIYKNPTAFGIIIFLVFSESETKGKFFNTIINAIDNRGDTFLNYFSKKRTETSIDKFRRSSLNVETIVEDGDDIEMIYPKIEYDESVSENKECRKSDLMLSKTVEALEIFPEITTDFFNCYISEIKAENTVIVSNKDPLSAEDAKAMALYLQRILFLTNFSIGTEELKIILSLSVFFDYNESIFENIDTQISTARSIIMDAVKYPIRSSLIILEKNENPLFTADICSRLLELNFETKLDREPRKECEEVMLYAVNSVTYLLSFINTDIGQKTNNLKKALSAELIFIERYIFNTKKSIENEKFATLLSNLMLHTSTISYCVSVLKEVLLNEQGSKIEIFNEKFYALLFVIMDTDDKSERVKNIIRNLITTLSEASTASNDACTFTYKNIDLFISFLKEQEEEEVLLSILKLMVYSNSIKPINLKEEQIAVIKHAIGTIYSNKVVNPKVFDSFFSLARNTTFHPSNSILFTNPVYIILMMQFCGFADNFAAVFDIIYEAVKKSVSNAYALSICGMDSILVGYIIGNNEYNLNLPKNYEDKVIDLFFAIFAYTQNLSTIEKLFNFIMDNTDDYSTKLLKILINKVLNSEEYPYPQYVMNNKKEDTFMTFEGSLDHLFADNFTIGFWMNISGEFITKTEKVNLATIEDEDQNILSFYIENQKIEVCLKTNGKSIRSVLIPESIFANWRYASFSYTRSPKPLFNSFLSPKTTKKSEFIPINFNHIKSVKYGFSAENKNIQALGLGLLGPIEIFQGNIKDEIIPHIQQSPISILPYNFNSAKLSLNTILPITKTIAKIPRMADSIIRKAIDSDQDNYVDLFILLEIMSKFLPAENDEELAKYLKKEMPESMKTFEMFKVLANIADNLKFTALYTHIIFNPFFWDKKKFFGRILSWWNNVIYSKTNVEQLNSLVKYHIENPDNKMFKQFLIKYITYQSEETEEMSFKFIKLFNKSSTEKREILLNFGSALKNRSYFAFNIMKLFHKDSETGHILRCIDIIYRTYDELFPTFSIFILKKIEGREDICLALMNELPKKPFLFPLIAGYCLSVSDDGIAYNMYTKLLSTSFPQPQISGKLWFFLPISAMFRFLPFDKDLTNSKKVVHWLINSISYNKSSSLSTATYFMALFIDKNSFPLICELIQEAFKRTEKDGTKRGAILFMYIYIATLHVRNADIKPVMNAKEILEFANSKDTYKCYFELFSSEDGHSLSKENILKILESKDLISDDEEMVKLLESLVNPDKHLSKDDANKNKEFKKGCKKDFQSIVNEVNQQIKNTICEMESEKKDVKNIFKKE